MSAQDVSWIHLQSVCIYYFYTNGLLASYAFDVVKSVLVVRKM